MAVRILVVEDEENLADVIKMNLELERYDVVHVARGDEAVSTFKKERFDLIVLDVMLPGLDGFAVCQSIRLENTKVPILFLTARSTPTDRINGLKLGGDDYLTKPFNLEEFLLRVQNLLKRTQADVQQHLMPVEVAFGENSVNFQSFEIQTFSGERHVLSKREIMLLKLLIERKNEVVSREQILETVWGYDVYPTTRTIDNYILAFRKYFEPNPKESIHFHSVRGVGYKFTDN